MNEWIQELAGSLPAIARPILAIAVALLGAAVGRVLGYLLARYGARIATRVGQPMAKEASRALGGAALATGLMWGAHEGIQVLDISKKASRAASNAVFGLGVLFAAMLVHRLLSLTLGWYAAGAASRSGHTVDTQLMPLLGKLITVFVIVTAVVILLKGYGYDISTLLVSLGVGSLAIGLAMQPTLTNMIAGFTIMLDRPFRIGDRVQLATGESGEVVDIGLRSTRLRSLDLSSVIIPNAVLVSSRVTNQTFPEGRARPVLVLNVAYGSDPARVKRSIGQALEAEPSVEKQPPPAVLFAGFGEAGLPVSVRFTVARRTESGAAVDRVVQGILERFRSEGIALAQQPPAAPPSRGPDAERIES